MAAVHLNAALTRSIGHETPVLAAGEAYYLQPSVPALLTAHSPQFAVSQPCND